MIPLSRDEFTRHEITAGLRANQDLIYEFANAWYRSPYTFRATRFLGHLVCKIPFDLWVMQDLMVQYRFSTVIETGTAHGGSALWYATMMDLLGINGQVITVDIGAGDPSEPRPTHPRIHYIQGSSVDPEIVGRVRYVMQGTPGPLLVDLDSDHNAPHVLRELELYAPLCKVGDWLIVEDTNGAPVVAGPDGQPQACAGPFAAVMEYLGRHPNEFQRDIVCERLWLTMNPHGWLQRTAACSHTGGL